MAHIRIERADDKGRKRIGIYDRIYAVGEDDAEVDISNAVKGWNLSSSSGGVELLTLEVFGARLVEHPELIPYPDLR